MSLDIFLTNNLNNKKEKFIPINPKNIGMYVCGPTVYDDPHIGNARPIVIFDVLYKILKKQYPKVTYVRNITDVDDKIIKSSKDNNISISDLTEKIIKSFSKDCAYLNCDEPNFQPKATEHISIMIEMVENLIAKGFAYSNNNHVYFEVKKFKDYGKLSNKKLEDLIAGSRIEVSDNKKNSEDFVLWKPSNPDEPFWDSPWGKGRPGWHLECSAMSKKFLGNEFDIHGGGIDLIFPHHENEIAQSTCCHDQKMANYWLHNGFINFQGEKMSKSLGNITIMNELLTHHNPTSIKYAILTTHYRQPIDFSNDLLKYSSNIVSKWRDFIQESTNNDLDQAFLEALEDDLNTPQALMRLQQIFNELKKSPKDKELSNYFNNGLSILGLIPHYQDLEINLDNDHIENMITRRADAKLNKNFELADQIREELLKEGIILEDTKSGTKWKKI